MELLSEADLLGRFMLPDIGRAGGESQAEQLHFIRGRWPTLRDDQRFVERLQQVSFVPVCTQTAGMGAAAAAAPPRTARAKELFHPSHPILSKVFMGEAVFPAPCYCEDAWLPMLTDLGLRQELDAALFLRCAQRVQDVAQAPPPPPPAGGGEFADAVDWEEGWEQGWAQGYVPDDLDPDDDGEEDALDAARSGAQAEAAAARRRFDACLEGARELALHFVRHANTFAMHNGFSQTLATLSFIPVAPAAAAAAASADHDDADGDDRGDSCAAAAGAVASFGELALPRDWALCWTQLRQCPQEFLPPQPFWSRLGLRTPPPLQTVLAHLAGIGSNTLERWAFATPLQEVFCKIFEHLSGARCTANSPPSAGSRLGAVHRARVTLV